MDADQLCDFYEKMCNEHPLLCFIEDTHATQDLQGQKKFIDKLKQSHAGVTVSISSLFDSNIDKIKEFTTLVQEESEEEEEKAEGEEENEEEKKDEEAPADQPVEEKKDAKKDKKGKKGAPEPTQAEEGKDETPGKPDPNADKIIPGAIRIKREKFNSAQQLQQIINYSLTLKSESFQGIVIEDSQIESLNSDVIDLAFGAGIVSYINLTGFGKPEKSSKVARYNEIMGGI